MNWPMTICLTFDDGLKDHHDVVAPALEARDWRGVFSVPTSFPSWRTTGLSTQQLKDVCLEKNPEELMDWSDVRDLIKSGHEVFPHTCDHVDLLELEEKGETQEVSRQVNLSGQILTDNVGEKPRFFCSPHNSSSAFIRKVVHCAGMELVNCDRPNFGGEVKDFSAHDIGSYLLNAYFNGVAHVDVMAHGILAAHGGWRPFADFKEFCVFLDQIVALENKGLVKVVSYFSSHRHSRRPALKRVGNLIRRLIRRNRKNA